MGRDGTDGADIGRDGMARRTSDAMDSGDCVMALGSKTLDAMRADMAALVGDGGGCGAETADTTALGRLVPCGAMTAAVAPEIAAGRRKERQRGR